MKLLIDMNLTPLWVEYLGSIGVPVQRDGERTSRPPSSTVTVDDLVHR